MTKTKTRKKTKTMTKTFIEHPQRVIQETCDLWDIWSEWWGDMTWPKKTLTFREHQQREQQKDLWSLNDYISDNWEQQSQHSWVPLNKDWRGWRHFAILTIVQSLEFHEGDVEIIWFTAGQSVFLCSRGMALVRVAKILICTTLVLYSPKYIFSEKKKKEIYFRWFQADFHLQPVMQCCSMIDGLDL